MALERSEFGSSELIIPSIYIHNEPFGVNFLNRQANSPNWTSPNCNSSLILHTTPQFSKPTTLLQNFVSNAQESFKFCTGAHHDQQVVGVLLMARIFGQGMLIS
jgi:hypothetical protein